MPDYYEAVFFVPRGDAAESLGEHLDSACEGDDLHREDWGGVVRFSGRIAWGGMGSGFDDWLKANPGASLLMASVDNDGWEAAMFEAPNRLSCHVWRCDGASLDPVAVVEWTLDGNLAEDSIAARLADARESARLVREWFARHGGKSPLSS